MEVQEPNRKSCRDSQLIGRKRYYLIITRLYNSAYLISNRGEGEVVVMSD